MMELEYCSAHTKNNARGFVAKVMTAEFQADAVMMGRVVTVSTVMVMTPDAGIPVLSGDNCIATKDFTKERNIQIVSTSGETLRNAMRFLSKDSHNRVTYTPARYPIFESISERKLRALMSLYLGCDVYVKGMPGVGPKSLGDIVKISFPEFQKRCPHATLFSYLKKYL